MTLSQVVESYIAYKRSLGKDFKSKAATDLLPQISTTEN